MFRNRSGECGLPMSWGRDRRIVLPTQGPSPVATCTSAVHDATAPASQLAHCQHHPTQDAHKAIDKMASGRAPSSTPVPTTETAESAGATSTVTDLEWEAMSTFLKNVYDY